MWEIAVHLAVAGGVYDGVFSAVLFPMRCLDGILDLLESVSEGFPTYSNKIGQNDQPQSGTVRTHRNTYNLSI